MNFNDAINFANENKLCFFASNDKDQPRVRALGLWFADETGFYFQTGEIKEMHKQLYENPKCEFCFFKNDDKFGTMMRVSGSVEFLDDIELKKRVIKDRPFLAQFGLTAESKGLLIFRVSKGTAHFWNMESNLKEKELIHFG